MLKNVTMMRLPVANCHPTLGVPYTHRTVVWYTRRPRCGADIVLPTYHTKPRTLECISSNTFRQCLCLRLPHRTRYVLLRSVRLFVRLSVRPSEMMFVPQYLWQALTDAVQTYASDASQNRDELLRF